MSRFGMPGARAVALPLARMAAPWQARRPRR